MAPDINLVNAAKLGLSNLATLITLSSLEYFFAVGGIAALLSTEML
jgi:hypothetical protein